MVTNDWRLTLTVAAAVCELQTCSHDAHIYKAPEVVNRI